MSLRVAQILVGGFDDNFSYLLYDEATKEAAYIDPTGNTELVTERTAELGLIIVAIWITHTHFDHIDKLNLALAHYPVPVFVHERGAGRLGDVVPQALSEGSILALGNTEIAALYTPGHLDDSVCFYSEDTASAPILITGDTLFVEGCGRTNEKEVEDLYNSLQRLKTLPPETILYPGHDYGTTPTSTIGRELQNNKYLLVQNFAEFKKLRLG